MKNKSVGKLLFVEKMSRLANPLCLSFFLFLNKLS